MPNTSRIINYTIAHNSKKYLSPSLTNYEKAESSFSLFKYFSRKLLDNFKKQLVLIQAARKS